MRKKGSLLWFMLVLGAGLFLVLGSACGGGGDDDDDNGGDGGDGNGATATEDAGNDGGGGDGSETATPEGDGGGDDSSDGDLADALDQLSSEVQNLQGRVTYEVTSGGETSTMTYYADGDRSRIDFASADGSSIFINTPEASYSCFGDDSGGQCVKSESTGAGAADLLPFIGQYTDPESLGVLLETFGGVDVDYSEEEIAGMDARCFTYSGTVEDTTGSGKYCFADSGLMLLVQFSDETTGDTYTMQATEASDEVSDSDFEPPYEIFDPSAVGG